MSRPTLNALLVRYVEARDEVTVLTRLRAACVCDFEHGIPLAFPEDGREPLRVRHLSPEADTRTCGRRVQDAATSPCWMHVRVCDDGETGAIGDWSEEGWCEPCRERQRRHLELRAALRRRTARLAALISATRARLGVPAPTKPEPPPDVSPDAPPRREVRPTPWDDDDDHPF